MKITKEGEGRWQGAFYADLILRIGSLVCAVPVMTGDASIAEVPFQR